MISRLSKLSRFSTVEFQNTVAVCWKAERCCSRSFAHLPLNRSIRLASTTTADKWQNTIDNLQKKQGITPSILIDDEYLEKTKASNLLLTIERQGESLSVEDLSKIVDTINDKSPKTFSKDMEKLLINLSKKRKNVVLKNVFMKMDSIDPKIVSSYRLTEVMARLCMNMHDKELYDKLIPTIEKNKKISPFNRGFYLRFISTLHHLDEAIDDYAELTPDYLQKNATITSELLTGMYNGGYFTEVVHFVDYLKMSTFVDTLDSVNYARVYTEYLKAKAKLGQLDDIQSVLDMCFEKHVLFLPLSYAELLSNLELCTQGEYNKQMNCAVLALRKYKAHTMTESTLLHISSKLNESKNELVLSAGLLSLPLLKINIVEVLGDLTKHFSCSMEQLEGKSVNLFPGPYMNEISQMINTLYPNCSYNSSNKGSILLKASDLSKYYSNNLLI